MNLRIAASVTVAFLAGVGVTLGLAPAFARPDAPTVSYTLPLTPAERDLLTQSGSMDRWMDEEILFREGLRRGFAWDDLVVRRQLQRRTRMDLLESAQAAPSDDASLQAFLRSHVDHYQAPARRSFQHVYLGRALHGDALDADARRVGEQLRARPASFAALGEAFSGGPTRDAQTPDQIVADFGGAFAHELESLPVGEWRGPIVTPLGAHWVRVTAIEPPRALTLDEARASLRVDMAADHERAALRAALDSLRASYRVVVDAEAVSHQFTPQDAHGDHDE